MKHLFISGMLLLLLASLPACAGQAPILFLNGNIRQGEMVFGFVTPDAELTMNGNKITPRPDGWFVFGIGRDEIGKVTLIAKKGKQKIIQTYTVIPREWKVQRVDGLPQNTVTPNEEEQQRITEEAVTTQQARQTTVNMLLPLCFSMPAEGRISSVYGSQRIMNGIPGAAHNAVDIANKEGTPIYAPADGTVLLDYDEMLLSGKTLLIGHGQDVTTSYIHLSKIFVKNGQKVKKGDKIGLIGMTGRATGPHLHWTVMWKNIRVDPLIFLDNSGKFCPVTSIETKPSAPSK